VFGAIHEMWILDAGMMVLQSNETSCQCCIFFESSHHFFLQLGRQCQSKKSLMSRFFLFGALTPNSSIGYVMARRLESRVTLKAEPIKLLVRQSRNGQHVHAAVGGQERN
jgi:hypothetical protein